MVMAKLSMVRPRMKGMKKRLTICHGRVMDVSGKVFATAEGSYLPMPETSEAEMLTHLVFQPDDWRPGEVLPTRGAAAI